MKKVLLILALLLTLPLFAQDFDLGIGFGHTWDGSGSYLYGVDRRALNFQLSGKWISESGFGAYAGYTQDAVKLVRWGNEHNFSDLDITGLERIKSLDLGGLYVLKGDKLSGWISVGASGYDTLGETAVGWYAAVGGDLPIYKKLFVEVKAEYRSHCTDFDPMQASAFETGILLGYRF